MYFISTILNAVMNLVTDRRAAVAPIFGVLVLPLLGVMGLSIDVSFMLAEKTRAQNIADAGALDAIRVVEAYMTTNGNTATAFNQIQNTAQTNAQTFMKGMASQDVNMVSPNPVVTVAFSTTTNTVTATATLPFNYNTAFMKLFNVSSVPVSVGSSSSSSLAKFTQVIFLVDVSGSMGVAATASDQYNLQSMIYAASGYSSNMVGCAFACHEAAAGPCGNYPCADYRTLAKTSGPQHSQIMLKIDYAQAAVQDFTTKMAASATSAPGHLSAGIYTFSGTLNTVLPVTQDFTAISNSVSAIDLAVYGGDTTPYYGGTSLTSVLQQLKSKITNVGKGDGSSATDQLTYLILVTDGVEDTLASGYPDGHKTDTTWTSACTPIKNMTVNIATVQAQYVPFPQDQSYVDLVQPIYNQITPAMATCASSSDLALSASDGPGLETAIDSLFATVVATPRLTN
jgi:Flp pilus assembly protein TadG